MSLAPGRTLEKAITHIEGKLSSVRKPYWLAFGGLWGLIANRGVIPDGDLDYCMPYGTPYEPVRRAICSAGGYYNKKVMLDDRNQLPVYMGFNSNQGLPHLCISFWYEHGDWLYYCHDEGDTIRDGKVEAPRKGYHFKGIPKIQTGLPEATRKVEWVGLPGKVKVTVPTFAGTLLDNMYPFWPFRKQRYTVRNYEIVDDKLSSQYLGGACSPNEVRIQSMNDWAQTDMIKSQLAESRIRWDATINSRRRRTNYVG